MQRIVLTMAGLALLAGSAPPTAFAQAGSVQDSPDIAEIEPLLPPGISDFNLELYGKLAYLWQISDGTNVVEVLGDFSARMGQYEIRSRDAVVWFKSVTWQDRRYIDAEIYLWQGVEVVQPGGAVETGPVLLITLRSFGKLVLNLDSHARVDDSDSDLFIKGMKARRLLDVRPAAKAERAEIPVQVAPSIEQLRLARPKVRRMINYSADETTHQRHGDESVVIAIGNVFVSQGSAAKSGEYLELRADAAVLYLEAEQISGALPGFAKGEPPKTDAGKKPTIEMTPEEVPPQEEPKLTGDEKSDRESMQKWISAVYLEGDVVLTRGARMIRASKLYYDFQNDRALILDVVTRAFEPSRTLPIYVRAKQIMQLSASTYSATDARITTSEFHTPHVALGVREAKFNDVTPRNEAGDIIGIQAGTYTAKHTTLDLEGVPVAYWPFAAGNFSRDRLPFKSAKIGYNSELGGSIETQWHLFNLMGLEAPVGYDATLKLDYFTKRGPAIGIDMDYERDDYYGLVRSYFIRDEDEDDFGGQRGGQEPDTKNRGRWLWRHRQYFPDAPGWELSLETSYLSDDNFLESYERNEFENAKEQENLVYLLKRQDNWQFSTLLSYRINEFLTQTERLPDTRLSLIGEPLGDYVTFYSDNRAGVVRFRPDERLRFAKSDSNGYGNRGRTGSVLRADSRQELRFLVPDLGPVKLTPFLMARGTAWDDSPQWEGRGGAQRGMFGYGLHGNVIASRVYDDVESEFFDLHRLRHVVKFDATGWGAVANLDPMDVSPFDPGVEDIDDFGGAALGVRQRLQTKRGGPGRWRTVDWITLDVEAGFFHDPQEGENTHGDFIFARPEDSISSNFIAANFQYRLSDTTVFVYDGVYDLNRGNLGTSNIAVAVEREPRLSYFAGWRFIHDTDNSLLAFGANYKLNEKHTIAVREFYDVQEGRNFSTQIIYIRKWPRWYSAVALDVDRSLDDVGINISFWPEGSPRFGLGSKRYTGLADSVGLSLR